MADFISRRLAIAKFEKIGHVANRVGPMIVEMLKEIPSERNGAGKTCCSCAHRKVCWLRLKMNEVAVNAQNRGIASNAWVYFEDVAQSCANYLEGER